MSLRHIIGKNKELNPLLTELLQLTNSTVWVEDEGGKTLLGTTGAEGVPSLPLLLDEQVVGYVKGEDHSAGLIARLITELIHKEAEKKKLGSEVLSLYHEINVIFNFSEKLSQTIEPDAIAKTTLEQAMQSIPSESGVVVLWDEYEKVLQVPAQNGTELFHREKLRSHPGLLLKIGLNGQSEILDDISALKELGIVNPSAQSLLYAAMKVKHRIMGAIILAGREPGQFSAAHLKLLVTLALQSSAAIESALLYERNIREVKEREEAILRIHEVTQRFVPHEFIKSLGKETLTDVRLGDQAEKIVTVLFTDIRDYTTLSEKLTPEENFRFVCAFNARLGPIIRKHHGFVNQYLGDSIMAIFPNNADDALMAAIEMQQELDRLNQERLSLDLPVIQTGIGMHTGSLIMGITGDEKRMDATTISDTVNTASRIESLTKYYKSPLLLSEDTFQRITDKSRFHVRHLGAVRLKGKRKPLVILECIDGYEQEAFRKKVDNLSLFQRAVPLFHQKEFVQSAAIFEEILKMDPADTASAFYLENTRKLLQGGVPDGWSGVLEMSSK